MFWKIHEVQGTSGSKDHGTATEALSSVSTVQHDYIAITLPNTRSVL